jgi:predicted nucleotidyltransferase component of viral defense system/DNA-directed RNA polymerase subunit RPC12/RpoP
VITRADIIERVQEWGLSEEVVEKDYVLGWLLSGIASHPVLGTRWVFKGGTCLKKCYIETYRFSEDLDFTVLPGGPYLPEDVAPLIDEVLARGHAASGIDFSARAPVYRVRPDGLSVEGSVYYIGPRGTRNPARLKLDISANERVIRPPVLREIAHPYPDGPLPSQTRCYSFEELFAEKIRAMAQRSRPRDLYDIVNLFRRNDLRLYPEVIRDALREKCETKSVPVPVAADFEEESLVATLGADWENMLAHQLPALPQLADFLSELPNLFGWLEGTIEFEELPPREHDPDEDEDWSPPQTVATWGVGIPLEVVRFAATNHLLVELGYGGRTRLIEPYSLRMTRAGRILLHAERADGTGHRSYGIDEISSVRVTTTPFQPRVPIEFSAHGPLHAPPQSRTVGGSVRPLRSSRRVTRSSPAFIYRCVRCGREFRHSERNADLRAHNDSYGRRCPGRHGRFVGRG